LSHVDIARWSTRGSFALFAGNLLSTIISFAAIIVIARLLGPSQYGVYTLAILIPGLLLNLLGLGLTQGVTRFAAYHLSRGNPEAAKRMTLNGIVFILLTGAILSVVSFLSSSFLAAFVLKRPGIAPLVEFASLYLMGQAVFQAGVAALLGWSLMGDISLTNISQAVLRLLIAVPLVILGFAVYGALAGYAVSLVVAGVVELLLVLRKMGTAAAKPLERFAQDIRTMLGYSWTLFVGLTANNVTSQYVLVILAVLPAASVSIANSHVGYYQSASNFVTAISITSGAMSQALFPAFAHLEGIKGDLKLAFAYATKYTALALTPIIFLLMGASVQIITVPLGSSYSVASGYLTLLAFSNISLLFGQGVLPSFFNGVGRPRYYMAFSLVAAVLLLALAPLLSIGLGLGVPGLIYSVLASNLVSVGAGLVLARRHFGAEMDVKAALSILTCSILAFLCMLPLEMSHLNGVVVLFSEIVVFAFVYMTTAPLLGAIGPRDLRTLTSAMEGLGRFKPFALSVLAYERFIMERSGRMAS
jgi:stage V sporulation protein B